MSTRTNTHPPLTPLVGQDDVVARVEALLTSGTRLVTLVGGVGLGKTRVAYELASRAAVRDQHEGGVWWYEAQPDLSALAHCEQVAGLLGAAARLRGLTDPEAALSAVGERFAALGNVCLYIDRLPNLLKAAPNAVVTWLRLAPGLSIVATSQQRFGLPGERPVSLSPLPSSANDGPGYAEALFLARVDAHRPSGARSPFDPSDVTGLVERLEGNPLAIEVAAARCAVLTPAQLVARLERGPGLLLGTPAVSTPYRAALDEAWLALEDDERTAVLRLAVLGKAAPLEFVEAMLSDGSSSADLDAADRAVESLVMKSLVVQGGTPSTPLFGLNKHVLALAREKLHEHGRIRQETTARLERSCIGLAEAATDGIRAALFGPHRVLMQQGAEVILTVAEGMASRLPDPDTAVAIARIAIGMESACGRPGVRDRTVGLLQVCREHLTHAPRSLQVGARALEGLLLGRRGDFKQATDAIDEAAAMAHAMNDPDLEGDVLARAGGLYNGGDPLWAVPRVTRATELLNPQVSPAAWAQAQSNLSLFELRQGKAREATERSRTALDEMQRAGLKGYLAPAHNNDGLVLATTGDWQAATRSFRDALRYAIEDGDRANATVTQANLGQALLACGDDEEGLKALTAAAESARAIGDRRTLGVTASFFAGFALLRGDALAARDHALAAIRDLEFIWDDPLSTGIVCCLEAVAEATLGMPTAAYNAIERARVRLEPVGDAQLMRAQRAYAAIVRHRLGEVSADATAALVAEIAREAERSPPTDGRMNRGHQVRYAARFVDKAQKDHVLAPVATTDTQPERESPRPRIQVSQDGALVVFPSGHALSLARKPSARRVILRLVEAHVSGRNEPLAAGDLFDVGWPGERIGEPYRSNRVYVLVAKLRTGGFGEFLRHDGLGYVLDPDVSVEIQSSS